MHIKIKFSWKIVNFLKIYYYLLKVIRAKLKTYINTFKKNRSTSFICTIDNIVKIHYLLNKLFSQKIRKINLINKNHMITGVMKSVSLIKIIFSYCTLKWFILFYCSYYTMIINIDLQNAADCAYKTCWSFCQKVLVNKPLYCYRF